MTIAQVVVILYFMRGKEMETVKALQNGTYLVRIELDSGGNRWRICNEEQADEWGYLDLLGDDDEITQESLASVLDGAAQRVEWVSRYNGATRKQCWYLARLLIEAGVAESYRTEYLLHRTGLSKRQASQLIDEYKPATKAA